MVASTAGTSAQGKAKSAAPAIGSRPSAAGPSTSAKASRPKAGSKRVDNPVEAIPRARSGRAPSPERQLRVTPSPAPKPHRQPELAAPQTKLAARKPRSTDITKYVGRKSYHRVYITKTVLFGGNRYTASLSRPRTSTKPDTEYIPTPRASSPSPSAESPIRSRKRSFSSVSTDSEDAKDARPRKRVSLPQMPGAFSPAWASESVCVQAKQDELEAEAAATEAAKVKEQEEMEEEVRELAKEAEEFREKEASQERAKVDKARVEAEQAAEAEKRKKDAEAERKKKPV